MKLLFHGFPHSAHYAYTVTSVDEKGKPLPTIEGEVQTGGTIEVPDDFGAELLTAFAKAGPSQWKTVGKGRDAREVLVSQSPAFSKAR